LRGRPELINYVLRKYLIYFLYDKGAAVKPMANDSNKLLTVEAAAAALGLKAPTVRAWMARRKIGFVRLGRATRIPATEIERLIDRGLIPPRAENL
jgi:excisionase family DNA binding protein